VQQASWHVQHISDAPPQFEMSRAHPAGPWKRGRPPKVTEMPAYTESSVGDDDSKWNMTKLTVTKFACKLCGQAFNHQSSLFRHQITAHGRQKKARGRSTSSFMLT